jgi:hypothetical protein
LVLAGDQIEQYQLLHIRKLLFMKNGHNIHSSHSISLDAGTQIDGEARQAAAIAPTAH